MAPGRMGSCLSGKPKIHGGDWQSGQRRKGAPPSPCEVWLRAPMAFRLHWGKKSWAFLVPTEWVTFRIRSTLPHPALSQLALRSALAGRTQCQPPWSCGREEIPQEAHHVRLGPPWCPEPRQSLPPPLTQVQPDLPPRKRKDQKGLHKSRLASGSGPVPFPGVTQARPFQEGDGAQLPLHFPTLEGKSRSTNTFKYMQIGRWGRIPA